MGALTCFQAIETIQLPHDAAGVQMNRMGELTRSTGEGNSKLMWTAGRQMGLDHKPVAIGKQLMMDECHLMPQDPLWSNGRNS
jgi:hypothetical protein